jgi:hypothetical protein
MANGDARHFVSDQTIMINFKDEDQLSVSM